MGNEWENNGIGMGNTQRFTKSSLGLLFSRSGTKQGKTGSYKVSEKVYEKRPYVARFCELHKVFFLLLSEYQRMRLFAPNRMRAFLNDMFDPV